MEISEVFIRKIYFIPIDINECDNNTLNCSEGCLNLPGSAVCTCPQGFFLENDNKSCSGLCWIIFTAEVLIFLLKVVVYLEIKPFIQNLLEKTIPVILITIYFW